MVTNNGGCSTDDKTCDIIDYDTSSTISCSIATIEWLPTDVWWGA